MRAWLRQHLQSLRQTAARIRAAPFAALANILVIGVVLALPLGAYVLMANFQSMSASLPTEPQISVFLVPGTGAEDIAGLETRLKRAEGIRALRFVPKDAALAHLKASPGLGEVIETLRENPLPDAFVVTLANGDATLAERLRKEWSAAPGVAHVQVDSAWVRRVETLLRLGRSIVLLLASLLSVSLIAVTFNTIRLQILTQREEIEVSKLIGATDAFVRRPFYYWGAFLGAGGGAMALILVHFGIGVLRQDLAGFGDFYGLTPTLAFLAPWDTAAFLGFSVLLGLLGTYLSVSKHLSHIRPG